MKYKGKEINGVQIIVSEREAKKYGSFDAAIEAKAKEKAPQKQAAKKTDQKNEVPE